MHRDIKPDNVLVNTLGYVKLTDFGITKQLDETIGLAGTFVGTLNYMSPERMEGEKYSFEGDIWSLGIVLFKNIPHRGCDQALALKLIQALGPRNRAPTMSVSTDQHPHQQQPAQAHQHLATGQKVSPMPGPYQPSGQKSSS